jgi:CTP:molybdopterin cytidylyltransferase MocA
VSVFAVVLAAGRGRRMGGAKHLREVEGRPMLAHVVEALRPVTEGLVCVLRPGDAEGAALVAELGVAVAWAEPPDEGRAASVRAGVGAADPGCDLLIALADQPYLESADFARLVDARRASGAGIVYASYGGERGSPVLFSAAYRDELLALSGSQGGRAVIAAHPDEAHAVELDPARGRDLDRPEDLAPDLPGG